MLTSWKGITDFSGWPSGKGSIAGERMIDAWVGVVLVQLDSMLAEKTGGSFPRLESPLGKEGFLGMVSNAWHTRPGHRIFHLE